MDLHYFDERYDAVDERDNAEDGSTSTYRCQYQYGRQNDNW
jgi:hypothetical protein